MPTIKKFLILLLLILCASYLTSPTHIKKYVCANCNLPTDTGRQDFGVFVGADSSALDKMSNYNTVIIDAQYLTKSQITKLKSSGTKVYSYLNIGSLEDFRPYYNDFASLTLSPYENWPGEYWINVSNESWINYNIQTIAKQLYDKGVDGFFIDNIDVYYIYGTEEIYQGLSTFLTQLKNTYHLPVILNGGYSFVQSTLNKNIALSNLMNGVTYESVYSKINFNNGTFETNSLDTRKFYLDYFNQIAPQAIEIYIIEYTTDQKLIQEFTPYYQEHGYHCYISDSINLD